MGRLAQVRNNIASTGALPPGTLTFNMPAGYYVVAYLLAADPDQSNASRLTIAWAETFKTDIAVIASYLTDNVRIAGIQTLKELPYPVDGKWVCLATSTTVQEPIEVFQNCTRQNTAQYEALGELSSEKAEIAQGSAVEAHKLANAAAEGAEHALSMNSILPGWVPWVAGGAVAVGAIWGLARLIRG